jgi:chromosome segregation ATPase
MMARIRRGGVIAAVVFAGAANLSGQSAASARPPDGSEQVLGALLVEVRGLRAAMEQMASAGPRVQLFASRLQLQETRINNLIRRLDEVRDRTAAARREHDNVQEQLTSVEAALSSGAPSQIPREELQHMATVHRNELKRARATLDQLIAEENRLVQDLTTEQGRWNAINQQLDELERALARR